MLKVGCIGPLLSGKTTLFKALTFGHSQTAKTQAGHLEIHRGVVKVPDQKLFQLAQLYNPKKISQVEIEYFDLVGTLESEKKQEGEKTAILRECDELVAVCGLFQNFSGLEQIQAFARKEMEKVLADLIVLDYILVDKRLDRIRKQSKGIPVAQSKQEADLLHKCLEGLDKQIPCRKISFTPEEEKLLRGYALLTAKPILIIVNIDEKEISCSSEIEKKLEGFAKEQGFMALAVCAEMELELSELEEQERVDFMKDLGLSVPAAHRVAEASYQLMNLITFYTANQNEVKAWAIPKSSKALQAAGTVHSDMEKGFIKAEVINIDRLFQLGSMHAAKEKGEVGLHGKEYVVQEGDVIFFRFNP